MRHRCADDFYTPAGQRCQLLSVIAFRSGDRNEQKRERESAGEWERMSANVARAWALWVSRVELVFLAFGISWVSQSQSFLRWGTLCMRVCMCVHVCACLCLGLARRCCFLCPLAFVGAAQLPTPCSVQLFSWRTASCALCSVLSYRPTDHRVMT